jgi:hypothetical protein
MKLAEGVGFVPKIAIFWANITQFVAQFKYTPLEFCLTRLYNLLTLLLTVDFRVLYWAVLLPLLSDRMTRENSL